MITRYSLSLPCLGWEVPRELLLQRSELIPPPVLGTERFEENKLTGIERRRMIVQCKEEDVEKMVTDTQTHRQTDRLTCNILTQTSTLYFCAI